MAHVLYRIFSNDGRLLYVGATTNVGARIATHQRSQPWWDEATDIKLERFDTFDDLIAAERTVIETEHPEYNLVHSKIPTYSRRPPMRKKGEGAFYRRADGLWIGRVELPKGPDGKRRYKTVSSLDREKAEIKFILMRRELRGA